MKLYEVLLAVFVSCLVIHENVIEFINFWRNFGKKYV